MKRIALLIWALSGLSGTVAASSAVREPARLVVGTGCFWCTEADFLKVPGVMDVRPGYSGGDVPNPTYRQVGGGQTGHVEVVEVVYDPQRVSHETLIKTTFKTHDFLDGDGQFCDRGSVYRPVVFVADSTERQTVDTIMQQLQARLPRGQRIQTEVRARKPFWPAEAEHVRYAERNPIRYRYYRQQCGRDARIRALAPYLPTGW